MMSFNNSLKVVYLSAATLFLLSGCGSSDSSAVGVAAQTGYLVDAAVAGVEYSCGTRTGVTGTDGSFQCESLPVTFSIGSLSLGTISSMPEDGILMPQDLAGVPRTDLSSNSVLNLATLLQSLDSDGNPDNGISIPNAVSAAFSTPMDAQSLNISDVQALVESTGNSFVPASTAMKHLESNTPEFKATSSSGSTSTSTSSSSVTSSSSSSSSNTSASSTPADTTASNAPTLTTTPTYTNQDIAAVEVNGEINASIVVNSVDTNVDIGSNGKSSIDLNASGEDGLKDFNITLKDAAGNESTALHVEIIKDTIAPSKFSWVYGVGSSSSSTVANRRVTFDENISYAGLNITLSNGGTISNISVSENNVSFSYKKINTDENITIIGTDLAGNSFSITRGTGLVLKTGQTNSYSANDDGAYKKGVARSYTDNGDGTVTDNTTGLIWQDDADAKTVLKYLGDAKTYCENLTLAGATNWRLPSVNELLALRGYSIDSTFSNVKTDFYWTSTTYASYDSTWAWVVDFSDANRYYERVQNYSNYVRCVRDN